jgi:gamma-glutamyl:cysteine ligase YbdK (ATP-grasp superfamily)
VVFNVTAGLLIEMICDDKRTVSHADAMAASTRARFLHLLRSQASPR